MAMVRVAPFFLTHGVFVWLLMLYVMQDLSKAFKFFSLAAEQGWVDGQLQLGIMYYSKLPASSVFIAMMAASLLWAW